MPPRRAALLRLGLVVIAMLSVGGLTVARVHWAALAVGIAAGIGLLLRGMAMGGSLGNARQFGKAPADVSTRIGICLAAAGIASGSLGHDPPFQPPFQIFYTVCLVLACVIAVILAVKSVRDASR